MENKPKGKIIVLNKRAKPPAGAVVVDVTSRSKEAWSRAFSPFYLGPIEVTPYQDITYTSQNMENAWQFCKQYEEYKDKDKFLEWAKKGFDTKKAIRYPMKRGAKPMHHVWKGEHLGYIQSRKKLYAPMYAQCVEKYAKDALDKLIDMYKEGKTIALLDFDGYGKYNSLKEVMNDPKKKMGHAFVLAMMVLNERHWEQEK